MIAVADRRDAWVGLSPDLKRLRSELTVGKAEPSTRAKWRSSTSARRSVLRKNLTPPTLSETRCYISLTTCSFSELLDAEEGKGVRQSRFLKTTIATTVTAISPIARTQSGGCWTCGKMISDIVADGMIVQ